MSWEIFILHASWKWIIFVNKLSQKVFNSGYNITRFFPEFDDAHTAQPLLVTYALDRTICCKTEQLKCRILFSSSPTAFLVRHPDAAARVCAAASETSLCLSAFRAAPQRNPRLTGGGTLQQFWLTGGLRSPPAGLALVAHCLKKKRKEKRKEKGEHNFKTGRKL